MTGSGRGNDAGRPDGAGPAPDMRLVFSGTAGELFPIVLINALLTLVTLGFYRFWARTRVRRYLWAHLRFLDDPFEYTGEGRELFLGFVVIFFLILVPLAGASWGVFWLGSEGRGGDADTLSTILTVVYVFLFGVAVYRARRYRLSRTRWRGIRFGQGGSSLMYGLFYLVLSGLNLVTLGWTVPLAQTELWTREIDNSWLGNARFRFDGGSGAIYGRFALVWFTLLPSLGLSYAWYVSARLRHFARATALGEFQFSFDVTGGEVLRFWLANALLLLLTLGLATPFVQLRKVRFLARHLIVAGAPENLDDILQSRAQAPRIGEGLADAFDIGAI